MPDILKIEHPDSYRVCAKFWGKDLGLAAQNLVLLAYILISYHVLRPLPIGLKIPFAPRSCKFLVAVVLEVFVSDTYFLAFIPPYKP